MSRTWLLVLAAVAAALVAAPAAVAAPPRARAPARRRPRGGRRCAGRDRPRPRRRPHGARRPAAHANLATRRPLRASDRYRVGSSDEDVRAPRSSSSSRAREGSALTDTVERWLPGLVPGGGAITVRQLLNHTSGLADYAPDEDDTFIMRVLADRRRTWDPHELVAIGTAQPPLFAPGAALVVLEHGLHPARADRRGGDRQPARDGAARARSSRRCACATRASTLGPRIVGRHAHGYSRVGARRRFDISVLNQTWAGAAGAIVSTVRATSPASTAPSSAGVCCVPTCSRRCARPCPSAPAIQAYGLGLIRSRMPCGTFWGHGGETLGYLSYAETRRRGARRQAMIAVTADQSAVRPAHDARPRAAARARLLRMSAMAARRASRARPSCACASPSGRAAAARSCARAPRCPSTRTRTTASASPATVCAAITAGRPATAARRSPGRDAVGAVELDEGLEPVAERLRVDDRRVADDHAALVQAVHAPLDGRGGEPHGAAHVGQRRPAVVLEVIKDLAIHVVQTHASLHSKPSLCRFDCTTGHWALPRDTSHERGDVACSRKPSCTRR